MIQLPISKTNNIKIKRDQITILMTDTLNGYMLLTIMDDGLYLYSGIRSNEINTNYEGEMVITGIDII